MKKTIAILMISLVALCGISSALDLGVTGATVAGVRTITNAAAIATMDKVLVTYDNYPTNTIYFDAVCADGVTYRLGSLSSTGVMYGAKSDLIALPLKAGEKWKITTTETNVNLNIGGI